MSDLHKLYRQRIILQARDRCHMDDTIRPSAYELAIVDSCLREVRDALRELQGYCEEGGWMPMLKKYEGKTEDSDILPTYSVFDLFGKGGKFEVAEEK